MSKILFITGAAGWAEELAVFPSFKVGGARAVDHSEILNALERRDAKAARQALDRRLRLLIADVERYWEGDSSREAAAADARMGG